MEFVQSEINFASVERCLSDKLTSSQGISGTNSNGEDLIGLLPLWKYFEKFKPTPVEENKTQKEWYQNVGIFYAKVCHLYLQAFDFWESEKNCPISDDGVLGGFGYLTPLDARDSLLFIDSLKLIRPNLQFESAAGLTVLICFGIY